MSLTVRYTARSHVGRVRAGNEDSGYAGRRLLVVADGMGGHAAGEVASAAAVRVLRSLDGAEVAEPRSALRAGIVAANDRLRALVREDPNREGMGTTLTALLWNGAGFTVGHVGDSRAYVLRAGELTQITHDHTFVQTLVDEGRITADEAETHPQRSLILRSVSGHGRLEIDIDDIGAQDGDRLLVCSDGLSGVVPVDELTRILAAGDIEAAADQLLGAALAGGAPDNVTCVVAEVYDSDATGVLPTAAPDGILVGAATDAAVDGSGLAGVGDPATEQPDRRLHDPEDDEEELLRYAPRLPDRFRWLRRIAVVGLAVVVLVGAGYAALAWTQAQYYVGVEGDQVAIFQGVDQAVGGRSLSEVHEVLAVSVDDLPTFDREQVARSIPAAGLDDAQSIADRLALRARSCERLRSDAEIAAVADSPDQPNETATSSGTVAGRGDERAAATPSPSSTLSGGGPADQPSATDPSAASNTPTMSRTPKPTPTEPAEGEFDTTVTAAECGVGST